MRRTASYLLCLAVLAVGCNRESQPKQANVDPEIPSETSEEKLRSAFDLMQQGQSDQALEVVQKVLMVAPDDVVALRLAVDIQSQRDQLCEAGDLAVRVAELEPALAPSMLVRAFDLHLRCKKFDVAESDLKRAVAINPNVPQVHRLLAQLLNAQGRRIEASQHVRELIRLRDIQPNELLSLIDLRGPFLLASFGEIANSLPTTLFSVGDVRLAYASAREDPEKHLKTLDEVIEKFPGSTAAAALKCRILADHDQFAKLAAVFSQLPSGIEQQAEYWFAWGVMLAHQGQDRKAVRAFSEAIRRDPTDRESLRAMIASCLSLEETELALFLRERLSELDLIFRVARDADQEQARWISKTLEAHVRPWEATAWLMQAAQIAGDVASVIPELDQRHTAIVAWEQNGTTEQLLTARLDQLLGFKADQWPMPDRNLVPDLSNAPSEALVQSDAKFIDIATQVGIDTTFRSGFPLDGKPFSTYQVNGGGLAALDYDLDGRCDVYVVQSDGNPQVERDSVANQMYRLLPNQQYADVSETSGTADRRFGQGVCAGDVNQDGFPDLLIANIGINSIYLNQGDGTFREATELLTDNPFTWTSSLGLADMDGDRLPEIIEINYIDDPQAYVIQCTDNYMDCQPQEFQKSHDRVLRGQADGSFSPWQTFQTELPSAKLGFGLVVANFDHKFGNDFFVSNDGDFNHYWVSSEASDSQKSKFTLLESANLYGCNIGRGGSSQACMGIAFGDFNRNGTLDLHVTNFHNEPVNLFSQTKSGIFTDLASRLGLVEPSFGVLGFGTQAADFDNDGWLDLAVLNGHVYDGRADDVPFQMPSQLLLGSPTGFRLQDASVAGSYWQKQQLGRTLALLDWDRDGKIDLLANHLDEPVALLGNESTTGNWLQVELVGVSSERDAIGAKVVVESGDQTWHGWQTGGDGFMCTNEPIIHFGLGTSENITRLQVTWPTGRSEQFDGLKINGRYLLIEGQAKAHQR
ncbi:MAG: FG-GAP-like repeat-containing protein [Planctomycetota bacterium]|nr:FG-GAP-like repeat-containing protein [Planctomycetota bacterium]